ncbi:hypothetical protein N7468_003777 [Penicillium chermesinum]|uniref:Small GTPase n=1 Tax=Penicillium chermesinum TaxID=63820 RepID=A0A9W9P9N2_9EURO|nr:uncharacterized protein N7468_003777 [Penicillium chermesinum]KAJ5239158.1 hypothetical protein N7468_003777 [Penicillium chermesinum]KAJ6164793.1 hypothetical protein N7470_003465 [Penicillium chermesinum]
MEPLRQPDLEIPAVAAPQHPPAEASAPDIPSIPSEDPLEHPVEPAAETVPGPVAGTEQGYTSDSKGHRHTPSADYHHSAPEYTPQDDPASRLNSSPSLAQQPPLPTASRPGSSFSNGPDRNAVPQQQAQEAAQRQPAQASKNSVVIKVGMVGDAQIGKTSLMVKYVEGSWDEDYIQTLGVNFMEKTISIRNTEITFSIWDLGGQREFVNMLPLVCNDAVAILFMFDLTRKSTLNSIKEWYRQGRGFNKTAIPFLVGTKYDHFVNFPREDQEEISLQAKRFAKAMKASLIFSSTSHSINVQKIFKIVLAKAFDLKCTIPEIENVGEPLLLYKNV